MTRSEALQKILHSYAAYYNINQENPTEPFSAEAVFHSHNDAYFLVKSARVKPHTNHRNTDISLIIIADSVLRLPWFLSGSFSSLVTICPASCFTE